MVQSTLSTFTSAAAVTPVTWSGALGLIATVTSSAASSPSRSVAVSVYVASAPASVGVPDSTRVASSKLSPAGRLSAADWPGPVRA